MLFLPRKTTSYCMVFALYKSDIPGNIGVFHQDKTSVNNGGVDITHKFFPAVAHNKKYGYKLLQF